MPLPTPLTRCLFHPYSVIALGFTPKYIKMSTETTCLFARCFGAQAMTCGLLLGTSNMTLSSFTAFGLAMIPYIGWNFWYSGIGPARGTMTGLIWADLVGNVFFMSGSLWCAKLLREEQRESNAEGESERLLRE